MHACSVMSDCDPMDCSLPGSSVHRIFSQEYWSGLPFPSSGDPLNPGIKPASPALAGRFFTTESPGKPHIYIIPITKYLKRKKNCPIYNGIKTIKHLGINLAKEVKYLYNENYETLMKKN